MASPLVPPTSTFSPPQLHKATTLQIMTPYRQSIDSDIDTHLKKYVSIRPPLDVFQPMHHLVFSTPKHMASTLCVAACEVIGGERTDALPAAAALHLMHVATAAHENLLVGKNRPKVKDKPFGANIELLTGDGVVPLGLQLLAEHNRSSEEDFSDRLVRVIVEITRAVGSQGMVDVQYRKYASNQSEQYGDLSELRAKRSEFYACGAACGAILGGGDEMRIQKLRLFGLYLGMLNETLMMDRSTDDDEDELYRRKRDKLMELRSLALKELEDFDKGQVKLVSSVVDSLFS